MRSKLVDVIQFFSRFRGLRKCYSSDISSCTRILPTQRPKKVCTFESRTISPNPVSNFARLKDLQHLNVASLIPDENSPHCNVAFDDSCKEVDPINYWEEEDEIEPELGDGGDGGGIAMQNCPWGERALSIAQKVLVQFSDNMELFAFKTSPRGYIYVRLDKLTHDRYGCPTMDEVESFSRQYKHDLDEVGITGEIPNDLALEVSSPGADRLLRVPDDLSRFSNMAMVVSYFEDSENGCPEKSGVFILVRIEPESSSCEWKLADVRQNRDPLAKGRPLSRKRKEWRLKLHHDQIKRVTLYICHQ